MEQLKALAEICAPDPRNQGYVRIDPAAGKREPYAIEHFHAALSRIELDDTVPADIRDHFQTARNLALYSWFVYRFHMVAQLHAFATLEFALRGRLGIDPDDGRWGLAKLLGRAISEGMLQDRRFTDWPGATAGDDGSTAIWLRERVAKHVVFFRNNLAHGAATLLPDGGFALRVVRDAVNQLYASAIEPGA